jgi:hypothetical protein
MNVTIRKVEIHIDFKGEDIKRWARHKKCLEIADNLAERLGADCAFHFHVRVNGIEPNPNEFLN